MPLNSTGTWKRLDRECPRALPSCLAPGDEVWFVHEYEVASAEASRAAGNVLVRDFKLKIPLGGGARARELRARKEEACRWFAADLAEILPEGFSVCHIPGSRRPGDPGYDPRFAMLLECLAACRPDLRIERPFALSAPYRASHAGGSRRRADFQALLRWTGLRRSTGEIAILDDVVTTGAHFKACEQVLRKHGVGRVHGLFWALAVDDYRRVRT